jgi:NADH-quinone oxidoreductase subunit L
MLTLAAIVLFAPLAGFLLQFFVGRRLPRQGDWLTVLAIGASLVASVLILLRVLGGEERFTWSAPWFRADPSAPPWQLSILVDGLTAVMLFVVTLVSFLVHVFSVGYMHGDPRYGRFFAWLQMFSVSMLVLVLAGNFFHLFIGWELVGLCSYQLIGHWSERRDPANAARKAFITTRIGDVGMVVALMILYAQVGSFEFDDVFRAAGTGELSGRLQTWAALGLFAAAIGKSAQFPLHVWLPDAMEGPTPVSALIHAATMVAAGVYLVGRAYPLFPPDALLVVAAVGATTALLAGLIAVAQDDIKKVLAYSTVSQLGFMFLGLGSGAWHAGLFHLTTHAFFKALMFLGSGSVIHACHHEQDMRKMGGLLKKMPVTGWTFAVGVLAIAGLPFLSGFYSKDAILAGAWHRFPVLAGVGLAAATLTAFYMFRLFAMTFLGEPKDAHVHEHAHESPPTMTVPLVVLALLSVVAGYGSWHATLLDPEDVRAAIAASGPLVPRAVGSIHGHEHSGTVMVLAIAAGLVGLGLGFLAFVKRAPALWALERRVGGLERACARKFWFDELYRDWILRPAYLVSAYCGWVDATKVDGAVNAVGRGGKRAGDLSGATDRIVVDGAVRGTGALVLAGGGGLARVQSGRIRVYLALGVTFVALTLVFVYLFAF